MPIGFVVLGSAAVAAALNHWFLAFFLLGAAASLFILVLAMAIESLGDSMGAGLGKLGQYPVAAGADSTQSKGLKLVRTSAFAEDVLVNQSQILWIEVGDGSPNSSVIHFINGETLTIDYPPEQFEAD